MTDQSLLPIAGTIILLLFSCIAWIFGWLLKRWVDRIDIIDAEKANKQSTDERFNKTIETLEKHVEDDRNIHKEISDRIGETNLLLAKLQRND